MDTLCFFLITIEDGICTKIDFSKEFQEMLRSMAIDENQKVRHKNDQGNE